jgi:hypothetical protein
MLSFYKCPGEFFNEDEDFTEDVEQAIERAKDTLKTVLESKAIEISGLRLTKPFKTPL